jgi:hypothetical protein
MTDDYMTGALALAEMPLRLRVKPFKNVTLGPTVKTLVTFSMA